MHAVFWGTFWNQKTIKKINLESIFHGAVKKLESKIPQKTKKSKSWNQNEINLRVKKSGVFDFGLSQTCPSWALTAMTTHREGACAASITLQEFKHVASWRNG